MCLFSSYFIELKNENRKGAILSHTLRFILFYRTAVQLYCPLKHLRWYT